MKIKLKADAILAIITMAMIAAMVMFYVIFPMLLIIGHFAVVKYEAWTVLHRLKEIPDVEIVDYHYYDPDILDMEKMTAEIRVKDKGTITLSYLDAAPYFYPKRVLVFDINDISFLVFYKPDGVIRSVDIGTEGKMGQFFEGSFKTEADVIGRFDEILAVVQSWPEFPDVAHAYTPSGREFFYCIEKKHPSRELKYEYQYDVSKSKILFSRNLPWETHPPTPDTMEKQAASNDIPASQP